MAQFKLEFEGYDEILKKLMKLEADVTSVAEEALTETHKIITEKAAVAMEKQNLPAKGEYSTGRTLRSLQRTPNITWEGTVASVEVGFDIKHGGMPSVYLMYGTPKMKKVQALYDAFYGDQTVGQIRNTQKEIFYKALEEFEK